MGRANSTRTSASARWCFTAWKDPMGLPNCDRSLAYSAAMATSRSATPTNTAPVLIAARSPSTARTSSASKPDTTSVAGDRLPVDLGQAPRPVEGGPRA